MPSPRFTSYATNVQNRNVTIEQTGLLGVGEMDIGDAMERDKITK